MKYLATSIIAIAGLAIAPPSQAQDSAAVDAIANLRITTTPIAVEAIEPLRFGTVNAPNGTQAGNMCRYTVSMERIGGVFIEGEVDASGGLVQAGNATPSGCGADLAAWSFGIAEVQCQASVNVTYATSYESAGLPGVLFDLPAFGEGSALLQMTDVGISSRADADGNAIWRCPDDGSATLHLGGRLDLQSEAQAGDLNVGTITLEASY